MKCTEILIGDMPPPRSGRTIQQFAESEEAGTPFGRLIIALTEETAWPAEYSFSANIGYGDYPYLVVDHPIFRIGNSLVFKASTEMDISVRGVEDAICKHLLDQRDGLQMAISALKQDAHALDEEARQIVVRKARAAIFRRFPLLGEIEYLPFQATWHDLYAFKGNGSGGPLYVARAIDKEIVGGVASVDCQPPVWNDMEEGVGSGERHNLFWSELARAFAIDELNLAEDEIPSNGNVAAKEKEMSAWISQPKVDRYEVRKGVFYSLTRGERIVVDFGNDNLPARAYRTGSAPQE